MAYQVAVDLARAFLDGHDVTYETIQQNQGNQETFWQLHSSSIHEHNVRSPKGFLSNQGERQGRFVGAWLLSQAGVDVATPLAVVEKAERSIAIMARQQGDLLSAWLNQGSDRTQEDAKARLDLARRLGAQLGKMTAAGLIPTRYLPETVAVNDDGVRIVDTGGLCLREAEENVITTIRTFYGACHSIAPISKREGLAFLRSLMHADRSLCLQISNPRARRLHIARLVLGRSRSA